MRNLKALVAAVAVTVLLAACGGDDETATDGAADTDAATTTGSTAPDGEGSVADDDAPDDDAPDAGPSQTGNLSILSIDFDTAGVELINNTDETIDINGWTMCSFPTYVPISGVDPIGPGETVTITSTVAVPAADGELALYTDADFTNPASIVSYVEWGSDGHTRAEVAVAAGIWDGTALTPDGSTLTVAG